MDDSGSTRAAHIERTSPRAVFTELIACALGNAGIEPSPMATAYGDFASVLAEVGDRSRPQRSQDLLRLYERYLLICSKCDRQRLIQSGHEPPKQRRLKWWH